MSTTTTSATDVLEFWFSERVRKLWFNGNASFDDEIRERFGAAVEHALVSIESWAVTADSATALVIVLDQFTRNIFRGTPRAFAGDHRALGVAEAAVANGLDRQMPLERRMFLYMPFQHSESLAAQKRSLELFARWAAEHEAGAARTGADEDVVYAQRHHDIIERFGRFPHRNAVLGRASTPEELAFLAGPGSSF